MTKLEKANRYQEQNHICINQTEQNKKRVHHILVETIIDYLCGKKFFKKTIIC